MSTPQRSVAGRRPALRAAVLCAAAAALALIAFTGCSRTVSGEPVAGAPPDGSRGDTEPTRDARFPPDGPLSRGDCVLLDNFAVVDCSRPHELEVFRFAELPEDFPDEYPSADALLPEFEPQCRAELPNYVGSPDVDATRLRELVYWPSRQGWAAGQRWILCAVVEIDPDDQPRTRTGLLAGALSFGIGPYRACSAGPPSQGPLRVVPCSEPHRGEAVSGVLVLGSPHQPAPSTEEANRRADPHCRNAIDAYLGDPGGRTGVRYSWRYPLPESWSHGYTSVVCFAETDEPVTGTLRYR